MKKNWHVTSALAEWNPEDQEFWKKAGKQIATRNLLISIAALLLAFAVWMVWSVVVINLPSIGFKYSTNELFWLASLPGLSGGYVTDILCLYGAHFWWSLLDNS